jgi:hypothetical protein
MLRGIGLAGLVLALSATPSRVDEDLAKQAELAVRAGGAALQNPQEARRRFREAAASYESLRQHGYESAGLYRNQGSAYLLAEELPQALLAYRRGVRLYPADAILRKNLDYARQKVAYSEVGTFARPRGISFVPWFSVSVFRWLRVAAFVLYALGWLTLARWWMIRRAGHFRLSVAALVAAGLLASLLGVQAARIHEEIQHPLVIIADDGVLVRKGNGLSYPPRYETPLNRGTEARLLGRRGDWLQIELGGGAVGWVPGVYALVDEP